jgi:hypothetical protein
MIQKQKLNCTKRVKRKDYNAFWGRINKLLVIIIIGCGAYYIIGVNSLSIKGFVLGELGDRSLSLRQENEALEFRLAQLGSYENINMRAQDFHMVKVDKIDYITVIDGIVAKK